MKKTALLLIIVTMLTKITGFLRDIILSYYYGASGVSDAYIISLIIPTVIFSFIGVGISTTFIPIFSRILHKDGEQEANLFTSNVINLLIIISSSIIIGVLIFAEPIVKLFASGFDGDTLLLAVTLTKLTVFSVIATGILSVFTGYLQIKNNFIVPALINIPLNFFMILSIILSTKTNILILGYGKIVAAIAQLIFLVPILYKLGYHYKFHLNYNDSKLKEMVYLSLPIIIGTSVNQINVLIDRTLASQVSVGGISSLNYASQLNTFIQRIFVMSIVTVMFAQISKFAAKNDLEKIKKLLKESIIAICIFVLPIMVGSMAFASPIVSFLFQRGQFDNNAVIMTSEALYFYSVGMISIGIREVLARVFYSLQDTKTPMINASVGMLLNIILNVILVYYFRLGLGGLALATSLAATVTTSLMLITLRKKIGPFGMKQISISFLKILFASLLMGGLAKLSFNYFTDSLSQNLSLLLAIGVGAVSYFVIIYFMKIEDVDVIVGALKKKLGRRAA